MQTYEKHGYLNSDFKIFYLTDTLNEDFGYHYHDFYKVLIFLNGSVSYFIEGRTYLLNPFDIILVSPGEIHGPIIQNNSKYERIIIYISQEFFNDYKNQEYDLSDCFKKSSEQNSNLLKLENISENRLKSNIIELRNSLINEDYAAELYRKLIFLEFLINLNKALIENHIFYSNSNISNKKVTSIMEFINQNLSGDISIDSIAGKFFLNRSYLMHLFKEETGCTIGNYITEKRIFASKKMIEEGMSLTDVCFKCGFNNYVSFYRAFKNQYGFSPKTSKKSH